MGTGGRFGQSRYEHLAGRLVRSVDSRGRASVSDYDGEGRLVHTRDAEGNETWRDYNVLGQLRRERSHIASLAGQPNANLTTSYTYDDAGRTIATETRRSEDDSLVSRSATEYTSDANGRTETQIDRYGNRSTSIYDHGGRLLRSEQYSAAGRLLDWTAYEYDALGRTVRTTNRCGVTSESEYDELGRMTASTVTAGEFSFTTTYGYDKGGRQLWTLGPDGVRTTNRYDDLGRVTDVLQSDGSTTISVRAVTYNAEGYQVEESDAEGRATRWGYDDQ